MFVVIILKYFNLFLMFEGECFDYFLCGVNEFWDEIVNYLEFNFIVELYLVIKYIVLFYFFVNKNNYILYK